MGVMMGILRLACLKVQVATSFQTRDAPCSTGGCQAKRCWLRCYRVNLHRRQPGPAYLSDLTKRASLSSLSAESLAKRAVLAVSLRLCTNTSTWADEEEGGRRGFPMAVHASKARVTCLT